VLWVRWAEESGIVLAEFRGHLGPKQNLSHDLNHDGMEME
jgi:hypothetical protein